MISYIKGSLAEVNEDSIVVDRSGIGFLIRVPATVLNQMPPVGEEVKIFTIMAVKEDDISLIGFLTREERSMYKLLVSISGIGPKGALGILGAMDIDTLRFAILSGDAKTISSAPGIGKKTAERLVLELKDKVDIEGESDIAIPAYGAGELAAGDTPEKADAIAALIALGFSQTETNKAVRDLGDVAGMSADDIITAALKKLY